MPVGSSSVRLRRGFRTSGVARRAISGRGSLVVVAGSLLLAYVSAWGIAGGSYLPAIAVLGGLAVGVCTLRPHWGLYAFAATVILIPYEWRLPGLKGTSPNALMVAGALVGWSASVALRRRHLRASQLYTPLALALSVTLVGLIRHGSGFANVPLILGEGIALFVLAYHLIDTPRARSGLVIIVSLSLVLRNGIDIWVTVLSILGGDRLGAIRNADLLYDVAATSEAEWRGFLLPVLVVAAMSVRRPSLRVLFWVAALSDVAWLALSATRTAYVILGLAPIALILVAPGKSRVRVLWATVPSALLAILLATSFSVAWTHVLERTQEGLAGGLAHDPHVSIWRQALDAFLLNPLFGHSLGPSHNWFLDMGRTMGLVFLVPMFAVFWIIWRRCAFIRARAVSWDASWFVVGFQGGMLVAMAFSLFGVFFRGAGAAFYFWLFAGALEALYQRTRIDGGDSEQATRPVLELAPAGRSTRRRPGPSPTDA